MRAERQELLDLGTFLRSALQDQGLETAGDSQIVPVITGDAERSVSVAEELRKHGFWLSAVRPPTVPAGTSRLRLSITAAMKQQQLAPLAQHIVRALHQT